MWYWYSHQMDGVSKWHNSPRSPSTQHLLNWMRMHGTRNCKGGLPDRWPFFQAMRKMCLFVVLNPSITRLLVQMYLNHSSDPIHIVYPPLWWDDKVTQVDLVRQFKSNEWKAVAIKKKNKWIISWHPSADVWIFHPLIQSGTVHSTCNVHTSYR